MRSVKEKIEELDDIRTKRDVGEWVDGFIEGTVKRMQNTNWNTTNLSDKQIDKIDELWEKYCA